MKEARLSDCTITKEGFKEQMQGFIKEDEEVALWEIHEDKLLLYIVNKEAKYGTRNYNQRMENNNKGG